MRSNPQFKLDVGSNTIINDQALNIQIVRPENGISHAKLMVNDYKSKAYEDVFDAFSTLSISLRYGSDSWTEVFNGMINEVDPQINKDGEVSGVLAWGWEWALLKTNCSTSYGLQSAQAAVGNDAQDIISDIITNYVNKAFGSTGASTEWGLGTSKIEDILNAVNITFLNCAYIDNYSAINRVCEIVNAYAGSIADKSCHWFVDPNKNLYLKQIDHDALDTAWDHYWGGYQGVSPGTQDSSTIAVARHMIQYDFRKNIDEYANKVVLCADLRVPGYDYWTESGFANSLWGADQGVAPNPHIDLTDCAAAGHFIVGANSLEAILASGPGGYYWYPSGKTAAWDFTKIGSKDTIPSINFYAMRTDTITWVIHLCHDAANYFSLNYGLNTLMPSANTWYHLNFPIGPYFATKLEADKLRWQAGLGSPSWSDINYIEFYLEAGAATEVHIDDLHFAGKIVREAKDSSEITATKKEHQKIIRCDNAVDDSFKESVDTGTAARIAYAELLRRSQAPIVGLIQIPMAPNLLPGQTVHIHAAKRSDSGACAVCGAAGTYRIGKDMRVKELRHNISDQGFTTQLNLTDDLTNTFAFGVPTAYSLLIEQLQGMTHGQARDLKSSGIDPLIPRLSVSY